MAVQKTKYKARLGDTIFVWRASRPSIEVLPGVAMVQKVGFESRLDVLILNRQTAQGGGRPITFLLGCVPGDIVDITSEQLSDCGTWMDRESYFAWEAETKEAKDRENTDAALKLTSGQKSDKKAVTQPV